MNPSGPDPSRPAWPIYDAHNHLHQFQDAALASDFPSIIYALESLPLRAAVVNGTRPEDWPRVADLARQYKWIIPSYGLHPWYVNQVRESWRTELENHLRANSATPAAVGEIGLDRWIEGYDSEKQEEAFLWQLRLAANLGVPVTIHCLKAWGRLLELLQQQPLPFGFLLHSYGGPAEMIPSFVKLGAYFSLSGYFAHDRKARQQVTFRAVPRDRLLLETDAPDMPLPLNRQEYTLPAREGKESNHPANIHAVYCFAFELYGIAPEELAAQVAQNFLHLFHPKTQV